MNSKRQKKVYNLEYIEKILRAIPLTFILILTIVSIFISYVILDSKRNREIDLLLQKKVLHNEFDKKEKLLDFSLDVKNKVDEEILKINKVLEEHTYKIIGSLGTNYKVLEPNLTVKFLKNYEKKSGVDIVLFEQNDENIIYGHDKIIYLSKLIFGEYKKKYEQIVLKYISSQGRYNLQEWKNDLTGVFRLSFFDTLNINGKSYFIGSFSKLENIRSITKNLIINEINQLKNDDNYIWFFDLLTKITYNFKNKKQFDSSLNLLNYKNTSKKYEVLRFFNNSEEMNSNFDNYILYNNRYKFLISIDYEKDIFVNKKQIYDKYNNLSKTITAYIILSSILLIVSSLLFSNFTKKILDRYNKELQDRTNSLLHWKNRFELAIIASNDGLWDIDFENNEIYFSNKWLEIAGYKEGEIKKFSDWFSLIHSKDKDNVKFLFDQIFDGKKDSFICEYRLETKSGNFKWILARGKLFIDKDTGNKRMLMMSMDIDKNKRLKKELLDVELLVEDGKIAIFKIFNDENLTIKYISNAIKNYGYNKKDFEDGELSFLDLIYEKDINIVKVAIKAAINQNLKDFTFECRVINAANEIRWVSCRSLVLKDHSGNIISFYGYINDITKIKLSEEELKHKVEDELNKNREKDRLLIQQSKLAAMGEMLGNIAHQWRQPLNNISLFLQFIKDNYRNEESNQTLVDKYFDKSFTQIHYMSQTIDDFRSFYRPSREKTIFTISHAIDSTLEIIRAQLKNENIELSIDVDDVELLGFENELKQSFLNIFSNALDAIKQRRTTQKFEAYLNIEAKKEKDKLNIKIENNGGEIEKELISRVFEPYFTTKFESQGTGIGLYMTKSIIESNMKGKIVVKNIHDGVYFEIQLPLQEDESNG